MKMSDMKTLNLTSLVTKKTRRAKARLMQNFGKADKTTDELFEVYQLNFSRQQSTATNFQKHVKQYLHCLKELHEASKGLSQCLLEMHERDWPKHDVFENNAYELDHINEDLEEKLKESVLVPLEQYLGQFAEMREKISKRGRKLVDYDSQRHTYETLQQHQLGKQQHDDSKLSRSRDQLEEARKVYESLNNELHDELPALYDNRLPFVITVFQRLFASNIAYHNDNLTVQKSYLETVEHLARATEKGSLNSSSSGGGSHQVPANRQSNSEHVTEINKQNINNNVNNNTKPSVNNNGSGKARQQAAINDSKSVVGSGDQQNAPDEPHEATSSIINEPSKPPVYLHRVRATYKYLAEDEDELSFEAGEIIQVIEYDDPQEQEEGWLMGIKESNGQKGLFPANFTKEL